MARLQARIRVDRTRAVGVAPRVLRASWTAGLPLSIFFDREFKTREVALES
jgi:hypothetical protein